MFKKFIQTVIKCFIKDWWLDTVHLPVMSDLQQELRSHSQTCFPNINLWYLEETE